MFSPFTHAKRVFIRNEADINFGSVYENAVAQELVAHGFTPYYFNSKKRRELDFVIEQNGKVLPIEVKSGKDYTVHRALANIMECGEYDLPKAIIFNNNNLWQDGRLIYAPIYMIMFLERKKTMPRPITKLIYPNSDNQQKAPQE